MDSANAYELVAHEFLQDRDRSPIGTQAAEQWAHSLRQGATVIELACGGGYPVSRVLDAAGLQLWAVDSSQTLATAFRARFPHIPVQCARVQESDFFARKYDAAIAIGLMFLLSASDQAGLISRVAEVLEPQGRFLFTAPVQTGSWKDWNSGLECLSLGQDRYVELLRSAGFHIVATCSDEGNNHYYDAGKS